MQKRNIKTLLIKRGRPKASPSLTLMRHKEHNESLGINNTNYMENIFDFLKEKGFISENERKKALRLQRLYKHYQKSILSPKEILSSKNTFDSLSFIKNTSITEKKSDKYFQNTWNNIIKEIKEKSLHPTILSALINNKINKDNLKDVTNYKFLQKLKMFLEVY